MQSPADQYRQHAATCVATEYGVPRSVRQHNAAVAAMYRIVEEAAAAGVEAISELLPLLDEPEAARWLAHQLLEKCRVPDAVERRCLRIIEELAAGSGADAVGEQMWLREYRAKNRRA
jgi:hypothetical protein